MFNRNGMLCVLLAAVALWSLGCPFSPVLLGRADSSFNLTLDEAGMDALAVAWWNGTITIEVDPTASDITAVGTQYARAASQDLATSSLNNITITLATDETDASRAELTFDAPLADGRVYGGDVTVTLPLGLTLSVRSGNGNVSITGNTAGTTVELGNGDVTVDENEGAVLVELGNGNVIVRRQTGDVAIDLGNGSINVDGRDGGVNASVGNGNITIAAQPLENGRVIAAAANGIVTIDVPADFAATLELTVAPTGVIEADLDAFNVTDYQATTTSVEAMLNAGGGTIEATTTVGTIRFDSL